MEKRRLGTTDLQVTRLGFGAFKIGRNRGIKYPRGYELPDIDASCALLNGVLDMGVNFIDTAPAYGRSEERIGQCLTGRRGEFVLATKVGETFDDAAGSSYDFSPDAVKASVQRSLSRLRTDVIDLLLIHSNDDAVGDPASPTVAALRELRSLGVVRAIGMSAKTIEGSRAALAWADVIMVEYHAQNRDAEPVMAEAHHAGVGVIVKKGLASGHLDPATAIRFCLGNPYVDCLIVGTGSLEHLRENVARV